MLKTVTGALVGAIIGSCVVVVLTNEPVHWRPWEMEPIASWTLITLIVGFLATIGALVGGVGAIVQKLS